MRLIVAMACVCLAVPASADDVSDAAGKLASAVFANMAAGYMCRDALDGLAQFQAAVTIAENSLETMGYSTDDAVLAVDDMAMKFKNDPRAAHPDIDAAICQETVNARLQDVKIATARYNKAITAAE
jgi:hypothetical protein